MSEDMAYPGSEASAAEVCSLAAEYRLAAQSLLRSARKGKPLSRAPSRLCAIHAIELYLNAFFLHFGESPEQVRSRQHNLAERAQAALERGLILRKKTAEHLARMTRDREYLATRYGPELATSLSEVNRLMATLDEVGSKVTAVLLGKISVAEPVEIQSG